jgi:hypothetical protein
MRCLKSIVSLLRDASAATLLAVVVAVGIFALADHAIGAEQQGPTTTTVSMPIEGWADFLDETQTHVLDSVYLRGDIHFVVQVWATGPTNVQEVRITANLDGVSGTSPTTGQRYRAVGASSVDFQNPVMTTVDGLFTAFPEQSFTFRLHVVDPEPARLNSPLYTSAGASYTSTNPTPVPFICQAINVDGKLITNYMRCNGTTLLRPPCCTPVQNESGKVVAWDCPGSTYYPGHWDQSLVHLANCPASPPSKLFFPLYFGIPVFERLEFHPTASTVTN